MPFHTNVLLRRQKERNNKTMGKKKKGKNKEPVLKNKSNMPDESLANLLKQVIQKSQINQPGKL